MNIEGLRYIRQQRRLRGLQLLAEGLWPAEVARRVGVTRQSVLRWTQLQDVVGGDGRKRSKRRGRPPKLNEAQRAELIEALKAGAFTARAWNERGTLPRIAGIIKERFNVELSHPAISRMLQRLGWSAQRPARRAGNRADASNAPGSREGNSP